MRERYRRETHEVESEPAKKTASHPQRSVDFLQTPCQISPLTIQGSLKADCDHNGGNFQASLNILNVSFVYQGKLGDFSLG